MAEVQTNPLPVGRYWITAYGNPWVPVGPPPFAWSDIGTWIYGETSGPVAALVTWLGLNAARVAIDHNETIPPLAPGGRPAVFIIFRTLEPVEWTIADQVGWPNEAPEHINSPEDVAKDKVAEGGDLLPDGLVPDWVPIVAGGAVVVAGVWGLVRLFRG